MNKNKLEELRYDVAHYLLSNMSKGSQFQYALDKMLELCDQYSEKELKEILHKQKKKTRGEGF